MMVVIKISEASKFIKYFIFDSLPSGYLRKPILGCINISNQNFKWIFPIYTSLVLNHLAKARLTRTCLV